VVLGILGLLLIDMQVYGETIGDYIRDSRVDRCSFL